MSRRWQSGEEVREIRVERHDPGFRIWVDGEAHLVRLHQAGEGWIDLELDGRRHRLPVARDGERVFVHAAGQVHPIAQVAARAAGRAAAGSGDAQLEAPMPGQILSILVAEGETVALHQPLLVLEAMKMEMRIRAPGAGKVARLRCTVGEVVERGQLLVELEQASSLE